MEDSPRALVIADGAIASVVFTAGSVVMDNHIFNICVRMIIESEVG